LGSSPIFFDLGQTDFQSSEYLMLTFKDVFESARDSENCFNFAFPLVCHYVFPPCRVGVDVPTPRQICKEDCLTSSLELCPKAWNSIITVIESVNTGHLGVPSCGPLPYMNGGDTTECIGISDLSPPGDRTNTTQTDKCIFGKGRGYVGKQSVTKSGLQCQHWNSQTPHPHSLIPEIYGNELTNAENYCRNPGGRGAKGPWCYTTDRSVRWEYCDIPSCGESFLML
jgi:hypothetical protein